MRDFYIPMLMTVPETGEVKVKKGSFGLISRKWDVNIFDLATLFTKHDLNMPYELMAVFLRQCNMELEVSASSLEEAKIKSYILKSMLYVNGVAPFVYPYISSHSLNDYAGINSRDSITLRDKLPEELRSGLTSEDMTVEVWPFELTFQTIHDGNSNISNELFIKAVKDADRWQIILDKFPVLKTVQNALIAAPMMLNFGQSLLHIWTAIESIFPKVNQEVSFRVALYLTQLNKSKLQDQYQFFTKVKKAYGIRSKVAHGGSDITINDWRVAWKLLLDSCLSILEQGRLPEEEDLLREILFN